MVVRSMKSGDYGWIALAVGVAAYEIGAAIHRDGELLSEACDRYRAAHPAITYGGITYLAGHLARIWPRHLDPLCVIAHHLSRVTR